jgi:hypothetical protein
MSNTCSLLEVTRLKVPSRPVHIFLATPALKSCRRACVLMSYVALSLYAQRTDTVTVTLHRYLKALDCRCKAMTCNDFRGITIIVRSFRKCMYERCILDKFKRFLHLRTASLVLRKGWAVPIQNKQLKID